MPNFIVQCEKNVVHSWYTETEPNEHFQTTPMTSTVANSETATVASKTKPYLKLKCNSYTLYKKRSSLNPRMNIKTWFIVFDYSDALFETSNACGEWHDSNYFMQSQTFHVLPSLKFILPYNYPFVSSPHEELREEVAGDSTRTTDKFYRWGTYMKYGWSTTHQNLSFPSQSVLKISLYSRAGH